MSLLKKHLTPEIKESLKDKETSNGVTLEKVINSGIENPDSSIGAYAGDEESYGVFAPLFDPIISEYHDYDLNHNHRRDFDESNLKIDSLDPSGERIISTRIRVARNIKGIPFPSAISKEERADLEKKIVEALNSLSGDLEGTYYPLEGMEKSVQEQLIKDHFLFKQGDRFLESAGINRDWPQGRGIFHSADKRFLVWISEEDSMRIISMQNGDDLLEVFTRLSKAIHSLEESLDFAYNDRLGYLASCPTNLGTALRGSFHVKLPNISKRPDFKEFCKSLGLQARGVHGEHSESEGGIYDISNLRRLGVTEVEAIQTLYDGTKKLIELDEQE
ncbi:MAG: phosphagen kinase [Candidatus Paceibacterota bacterium]